MAKKLPAHVTKNSNGKYRVRYKKTEKYPIEYDKTFDTLSDAIQANDEYLGKIALKIYNPNTRKDIGFSDFCDYVLDWYRNKAKKASQNTIKNYRQYMDRLKPFFKNKKLRDITVLDIEDFLAREKNRQKITNGAKKGDKIGGNTLHHEYTALRMILNKATKWGFIENNPINAVEAPSFQQKKIVVPEFEEREEIYRKIMTATIKDRCMFLIAFFTGMRCEEVCGLHIDDIDRENQMISIERAIVQNEKNRQYYEDDVKSVQSVRTVPIPKIFFDTLDEYLLYRKEEVKFLKIKTEGTYKEIPNLFLNQDGHFYRPHLLSKKWREFRQKEDIPLTLHGLRHYYITNQMNYNDNLSPRDVQELSGHADIKTTYRYVHSSDNRIKQNALNIFEDLSNDNLYKKNDSLYKVEDDKITIPMEHIATIILGNPKLSNIDELQESLSKLTRREVNIFNISTALDECKNKLEGDYPSLSRIEKYRYSGKSEKEIVDCVKKEFGKVFQISKSELAELEL